MEWLLGQLATFVTVLNGCVDLAACRTEVYGVIANDGFVGAKVRRTLDCIQSALFRSLSTLRLPVLGCF
jgi:hypothetical protein